jgi:hypothetical protein
MSLRAVLVLLAALVVLAILVAVGQRSRAPVTGAGQLLVPGLDAALDDIESVTIAKGGGETVATLERRTDRWVVAEKNGYAADVGKLRQGLRALAEARILEEKTSNPDLYDRLGVEDVAGDAAAGITMSFSGPAEALPTLILGNAEGNYRYVRRANEPKSYLIDRNPDMPRDTASWLDATIVDVRGPRVQQVTITHPDGEVLTVSKPDDGAANYDVAGVPDGRELLYPGVANVIGNALRELNLEDVEPAGSEAAERPVVVEFRTFDGLVVRAVGVERDDQSWVTFEASYDAEQAASFAAQPAEGTAPAEGDAAPVADAAEAAPIDAAEAPAVTAGDAAAEAERINSRVGGWRYRIASFQYDQMTRRMADLLKPPA